MTAPRIAPGSPAEIGRVNTLITRAIARGAGGDRAPNVFTTLARHRRLFRRWLIFAGGLMPGGSLPRADTELVILRVARNAGSEYEWGHHERLGRAAGLTGREIAAVRDGAEESVFSRRQALLLAAADELHDERVISDGLWDRLCIELSERERIELCLLVGHYEMLAMTIASLGIQPDPPPRAG